MTYPRPPFILGVTGKMRLPGYDPTVADPAQMSPPLQALRQRVRHILDWARSKTGVLDPETGVFDPNREAGEHDGHWRALGLADTPLVLLSSLAPGADTLVAETVLDYAHETGAAITVRAPLPFPAQVYPAASTFCPEKEPHLWQPNQKRFQDLLARLKNQPDWQADRDLFEVALDPDLIREQGLGDAQADRTGKSTDGGLCRHLRYRAAGEYVAAYSDLLLALYDEAEEAPANVADLHNCGTATIVEVKRRGLSHKVLGVANNFAWVDSGPVLHVPLSRSGLRLLPPYAFKPTEVADSAPDDPAWQANGDLRLRAFAAHLNRFNTEAESETERYELASLVLGSTAVAPLIRAQRMDAVDQALDQALGGDPAVTAFVRQLDKLARVRHRAAGLARQLDAMRSRLLVALALLVGLAAFCLGVFEHWHPQGGHHEPTAAEAHAAPAEHGHGEAPPTGHGHSAGAAPWFTTDPGNRFQAGLLLLGTLPLVLLAAWLYHRYQRQRCEARRFDTRALAEALRVQFYWALSGSGDSVAANYMQRQRSEMDWIRNATAAIAFPYERFQRVFDQLSDTARLRLWRIVGQRWIHSQRGYFRGQAARIEAAEHAWHLIAWGLAGAGLLQVIGMGLAELSGSVATFLEDQHRALAWVGGISGALLLGQVWLRAGRALVRAPLGAVDGLAARLGAGSVVPKFLTDAVKFRPLDHHAAHDAPASSGAEATGPGFLGFLCGRRHIWGLALLAGSLIQPLVHSTPQLGPWVPDWHDWWIILTGALFLGGGLSLAFAERSFLAEHARQYGAMHSLYAAAASRSDDLLAAFEKAVPGSPARARAERALRELFYQLGCEALDENAEWLILHRTRPLELFMAG